MMGEVNDLKNSTSSNGPTSSVKRICHSRDELEMLSHEEIIDRWLKQDTYIDSIEAQLATVESNNATYEEKLRSALAESARRENLLLMKLSSKEREIQDLIVQVQELKISQAASESSLKCSLLDPAVNIIIQRLRHELEKTKSSLEETQNELSAWKFTPDSNTGKRLMAKCRLLYQENEELGRIVAVGRLAKLEGDLALQRNFSEEMKKSQSELDEFLQELDEDVEGMQSSIYYLQQQLRQARDQNTELRSENDRLRKAGQIHHHLNNVLRSETQENQSTYDCKQSEPGPKFCSKKSTRGEPQPDSNHCEHLDCQGRTSSNSCVKDVLCDEVDPAKRTSNADLLTLDPANLSICENHRPSSSSRASDCDRTEVSTTGCNTTSEPIASEKCRKRTASQNHDPSLRTSVICCKQPATPVSDPDADDTLEATSNLCPVTKRFRLDNDQESCHLGNGEVSCEEGNL